MDNHYIAGWSTPKDWAELSSRLEKESTEKLWECTYKDYFIKRLEYRYLDPIKLLKENGTYLGEGFSIMAILCSLIEFLESTYQGKIYRYLKNGEKLEEHEYFSSKNIFISFLVNRNPFSKTFDEKSAKDFYSNIRCGLLHEASTKGGWRIWAISENDSFINFEDKIIYRDNFNSAICKYITEYGEELKSNKKLQDAFIRKYNSL